MTAANATGKGWLYGPLPDLLLGCGLLYIGFGAAITLYGGDFVAGLQTVVPALILLLVSLPHYGATLVRVYEQREDRRRYVVFSLYATALLALCFGMGLYSVPFASALATVYLTWSPWHYTGQNYGISVMLLRRRGAAPSPLEKRLLYASFILSYALVATLMHGQSTGVIDPDYSVSAVRFIPLGIPDAWLALGAPIVAIAQLVAMLAWGALMVQRVGARAITPAALLLLTQTLWFSLPFLLRQWGLAFGIEMLDWNTRQSFFVVIAGAHAAQYLWVTSFYAKARGSWRGQIRQLLKVSAAGCAIWTLPVVAVAPFGFGYEAGVALLVASIINIHHFILDGAVWKLRNSRVASILIRDEQDEEPGGVSRDGLRGVVWSVAFLALILASWLVVEIHVVLPAALETRDHEASAASLDRLAVLGRDRVAERDLLGRQLAVDGDVDGAIEQFERGAALVPRPLAFERLLTMYARSGDADGIRRSARRLLDVDSERQAEVEEWLRRAAALDAAMDAAPDAAPDTAKDAGMVLPP
jgi:hypothetical protein